MKLRIWIDVIPGQRAEEVRVSNAEIRPPLSRPDGAVRFIAIVNCPEVAIVEAVDRISGRPLDRKRVQHRAVHVGLDGDLLRPMKEAGFSISGIRSAINRPPKWLRQLIDSGKVKRLPTHTEITKSFGLPTRRQGKS